jgi:hypothetical protein
MITLTISAAAAPPRPINKCSELTQFGEGIFGVHQSHKANNINAIPGIAEPFFRQFRPFFFTHF